MLASELFPAGLSANLEISRLEKSWERYKKRKPEEQADYFYDLAKLCFENKDLARARYYMEQSLAMEDSLKRPEDKTRTMVALAMILIAEGNSELSFSTYKKALAVADSNGLVDMSTSITASLGTLALRVNKIDEAEELFRKSLEAARTREDASLTVSSLVNLGTVYRLRKDWIHAVNVLEEAVNLADKHQLSPVDRGNAYMNLARAQHAEGKARLANTSYKQAAVAFNESGEFMLAAVCYWSIGENLYDLQEYGEAKDYLQKAYTIMNKEEKDKDQYIAVLLTLGAVEADLSNFEKAQSLHEQALAISKEKNNKIREAQSILQLGNDALLKGQPEKALHQFLDAQKLLAQNQPSNVEKGACLLSIGRCYKSLGQFEAAEKYYQEALRLYNEDRFALDKAMVLNSLAVLYLDSTKHKEFESCYNEAKSLMSQKSLHREEAILDYNFAQYCLIKKEYARACQLYEQAISHFKTIDDTGKESMARNGLGLAYLLREQPDKALKQYQEALKLIEKSGSLDTKWDANLGLGKSYKKLGQNEPALKHLNAAIELVEAERGQLSRDSFKTFSLDLRNDCFAELIDLLMVMNKPADALLIAEKGRARAFLDLIASRKQGKFGVEDIAGPTGHNDAKETQQAEKKLTAVPGQMGTRAISVKQKDLALESTAISPVYAEAPSLTEITQLAKNSNTTIIEYFLLPDKIVAWVLDKEGQIKFACPINISQQVITGKTARLINNITSQPATQPAVLAAAAEREKYLRDLYNILLKPLEPFLPAQPDEVITIVPHGTLYSLPFAALLDERNKYFIEKHTICYTPAIGVMRATQQIEQEVQALPDKLLAFGNPITPAIAFLGKLPYTEKEVNEISTLFGNSKSIVKIGQDANRDCFFKISPECSSIHLATHGLIDQAHPMQSALVLAPTEHDDGLLTVKDLLARVKLKAKLVVLSACQTGRGQITGDGVVGLARAFIIAGTPSVLVSQWNVDDIMTAYQMKQFYEGYLAKKGKARALRDAQLATVKFMEGAAEQLKHRANPRYWAAFQLMGEDEQ